MAMIVVVIVVLVMVMGIMMMMLMVRASLISEHIHIKDASDPRSMRGLHSPGGRAGRCQLCASINFFAKQILNRLLIDLSWNSSRLEGNTYSLLDTTWLIELG